MRKNNLRTVDVCVCARACARVAVPAFSKVRGELPALGKQRVADVNISCGVGFPELVEQIQYKKDFWKNRSLFISLLGLGCQKPENVCIRRILSITPTA